MTREEELKELELALSNGYGFENTKTGKELGFKEADLRLYAFNEKNFFAKEIVKILEIFKNEEYLYNDMKKNIENYKKEILFFISNQTGQPINSVIKTSDIKKSLEILKENVDDLYFNQQNNKIIRFLDIMRDNNFDVFKKLLSSDLPTLTTKNENLEKILTNDLKYYLKENKLNIGVFLSVEKNNENIYYSKIEEELKKHTKIEIPKNLKIYVEKFDFSYKYSNYENFYKMMVDFSISEKNLLNEKIWKSLEDLRNDKDGEVLLYQVDDDRDEEQDSYKYVQKVSVKIGDDVFDVDCYYTQDEEGISDTEEWSKNGKLHRSGGLAAKYSINNNYIASESYLNRAVKEFWLEGEFISEVKTTYDDILMERSENYYKPEIEDLKEKDDLSNEDIENKINLYKKNNLLNIDKSAKKNLKRNNI